MRTLYYGGRVWTVNPRQPLFDGFVVDDARFLAVGSRGDLEGLLGPDDRRIGLGGRMVVPGLIDAHVHFSWFSFGLSEVCLEGVATLEQALQQIEAYSAAAEAGGWIRGRGFDANIWGRWPSRHDLDGIVADRPVVISSKDYHSIWVNSEALRQAGIWEGTPTPIGGEIERDLHGHPTGILKEKAADLVWSAVPARAQTEVEAALRRGIRQAHEVGVTSVHDMDPVHCFRAMQALHARGELTLRVFKQIPETAFHSAIAAGLTTGFGDHWLRVGCLKLFSDGSLGSRTAHMLDAFEGLPGYFGLAVHSPEELGELIATAVQHGISVAIHAIGDAANRVVLDEFGKVAPESRRRGLRHRIEHAQLLTAQDLPRFAELGIIASVQPSHAPSDRDVADQWWGARCRYAYAFRSLAESGARLAFGSDVPVEPLDPLAGIHAAVWRKRLHEPNSVPWHPEESLTVAQAIHGFTMGAAYASGEEHVKGSIEAGKLADFVVLSHDISSGTEEAFRAVRPQATVVGGRVCFGEV